MDHPQIGDIAHPDDTSALAKILTALDAVLAALNDFEPTGYLLDRAVPDVIGYLEDAVADLKESGEQDLRNFENEQS